MRSTNAPDAPTPSPPSRSRRRALRNVALLLIASGAVWGFVRLHAWLDPPYQTVAFSVPDAPRLNARAGETVYRIDPARSSASYAIAERIVGHDASTAVGRSHGIAGDLAIDPRRANAARLGPIVVNVEELDSGETLRDARIRSSYLESHRYPLATFTTSAITGLPERITPDHRYTIELRGRFELHAKSREATWKARVQLHGGRVHATATTTITLSDFGVGPISIAGLVSTSNRATVSLDLVAVDPSKESISTTLRAGHVVAAAGGADVSFAKRVEPILEANCASCHASGTVGGAVWRLDTADDAANSAAGIALVTGNRYMPPWPASHLSVPFRDNRSLSDTDIATLAAWVRGGAPLDVPRTKRLVPGTGHEPRFREDVVMQMPQRYRPDPAVQNDYQCFILDPHFTNPEIVTGLQFLPDRVKFLHHALIYRVSGHALADAQTHDRADPAPGWNCSTDAVPLPIGPGAQQSQRAFIGTWVPGGRPEVFDPNEGFRFEPTDKVLVQIHYHLHHVGQIGAGDQSALAFQTERPNPSLHELLDAVAAAPVELPCPAAAHGPLCSRAAELADQARQYGASGPLVQLGLELGCGNHTTSDRRTGNGTSRCDLPIAVSGHIINVMGHMHTRGSTIRLTLNPGTPRQRVLLDVPHWSFGWQLTYQPISPVPIRVGDTLRIQCSWDRSQVHDPNPHYIVFAEGTEDEMCFATYTIDPGPTSSTSH